MKEIIEFLRQRRNIKYSLGIIIFGLIFAFSFQVNRAQISQILEKPVRIVPGTKETRQYQVSGWQGAYAKGKRSILKVGLPEKKTYRMVVRAFSCSPPDTRDQRIEVHFNNIAIDRLKFRKTPKWQEFKVNIHPYLLKETNTIKFVYTQDTFLSPIAFDSLEFRNYTFRIRGFYLLFDSPIKKRADYLSPRVLGYSFGFAILLLVFWLFYSRFLSLAVKMKFSRAIRIDFWSWFPSIILLSLLALVSFFSSCHFVFSIKTFFVLALAPTIVFRPILHNIEKICLEIKSTTSFLKRQVVLKFFPFTKVDTLRKFLIRYHKTNLSSAFILDFILLLVLSALLLMIKGEWIAEQIANLAYLLLVIGVVMKAVAFFREDRRKK